MTAYFMKYYPTYICNKGCPFQSNHSGKSNIYSSIAVTERYLDPQFWHCFQRVWLILLNAFLDWKALLTVLLGTFNMADIALDIRYLRMCKTQSLEELCRVTMEDTQPIIVMGEYES